MIRCCALLANALILFSISCCSDENKGCPDYLQYQVPYTASPIKDTFQLGDTIWIEMDFSDHLTDLHGGITNTFSNKSSEVPVYRDMTLERFGEGFFCFFVKP